MKTKTLIILSIAFTILVGYLAIFIIISQQKEIIKLKNTEDTIIHEIVLDCYTYDMCLEHIMLYESYRSEPYELDGAWYIGYGKLCSPDNPPITEVQATIQLQETFDWYIRFVVDKYNVHGEKALALALLWYNVAPTAILSANISLLMLNNSTDDLAIRESWLSLCNFQGKPHVKLRERRLFEVNLYFNN